MIKLVDVSKTFFLGEDRVVAVADISLEIKDKEMVGILGTSGSGKSTLMYLIGLLDTPPSGQIFLDKKDVSKLNDDELSKIRNEHVGFVFQSFNLINKFTVLENVILPTQFAKKDLDFDPEKRAEELLKKVGIWQRKDFFPNKISGGQQQRVAIARALMMRPMLILADEPTGNLDSKTGEEIMKLLGDLNKDLGVTIVVVTHELEIAKKMKRQIYIRDGKVVAKYL